MRGLETGPPEATQADEVAGVWRADKRHDDGEALTTAAAELLLADGFEARAALRHARPAQLHSVLQAASSRTSG